MLNLIKIRLPISRDTAFLIENPGDAHAVRESLTPEALSEVQSDLDMLITQLVVMRDRLETPRTAEEQSV